MGRVHRDELGVGDVVDLSRQLERIAVDKAATLGGVGVLVDVERQVAELVVVDHQVACKVDRGVVGEARLVVESIQVESSRVGSVVPCNKKKRHFRGGAFEGGKRHKTQETECRQPKKP